MKFLFVIAAALLLSGCNSKDMHVPVDHELGAVNTSSDMMIDLTKSDK